MLGHVDGDALGTGLFDGAELNKGECVGAKLSEGKADGAELSEGNDDGNTDGKVLGASVTSTTTLCRVELLLPSLPSLVNSGSLVTFSRDSWAAAMKADNETGSVSLLFAFPLFEFGLGPTVNCALKSVKN